MPVHSFVYRVQRDIASDLLSDMDVNKIDNLLWLWELAHCDRPYAIQWRAWSLNYAQDRRLNSAVL